MIQENKETNTEQTTQDAQAHDDASVNALARKYRHIGFAIFGGLAALVAIFLAYSAITGLQNGEIYDPITNEPVITK